MGANTPELWLLTCAVQQPSVRLHARCQEEIHHVVDRCAWHARKRSSDDGAQVLSARGLPYLQLREARTHAGWQVALACIIGGVHGTE